MRTSFYFVLALGVVTACGDNGNPSDPSDTGDFVSAEIGGATFDATEAGVELSSAVVTLEAASGQQHVGVTFPNAVGTYSCASEQSGVTTIGLEFADLASNVRASASFGVPGSTCTIEVTEVSSTHFAGTFTGQVIANDEAKTSVELAAGAFDVTLK